MFLLTNIAYFVPYSIVINITLDVNFLIFKTFDVEKEFQLKIIQPYEIIEAPMKKIFLLILLTMAIDGYAQEISYIIPDIGIPGRSTYIEIIGPHDSDGNFFQDGLYENNPGDAVRIVHINPEDTARITFGPVIVAWRGRMISTQVFVHPWLTPNSSYWNDLEQQYRIPFRVIVNGSPSNIDTFYVIKPYQIGDIRTNAARVFGGGALGKRSRRGAMWVDSLLLADDTYRIDLSDCDPDTDGNQGYLPFVLLTEKVVGQDGTIIDAGALNIHGGPGGGGGGGRYCDVSGSGSDGGDGYTGGGPGGYNDSDVPFTPESSHKNAGIGTGGGEEDFNSSIWGGKSLNGVRGGSALNFTYESAGGGTGHPFGESGIGCNSGSSCDPPGGHGGGSGYNHGGLFSSGKRGGCGGYTTDGPGDSKSGGKWHGNKMVVPVAGGSGGASGNPQAPGGGCSGNGGGGGGAVVVYGRNGIERMEIRSYGGDRQKSGHGSGGNGSGGFVAAYSNMNVENLTLSVPGGNDSLGGAGRIRQDAINIGSNRVLPLDASEFRGVAIDTNTYIRKGMRISGTRPQDGTIRVYVKPYNGEWAEAGPIDYGNSISWGYSENFIGTDTVYFIVAMYDVPEISTDAYKIEPPWLMSQASAKIIMPDRYPIIASETLRRDTIARCEGNEWYDTLYVRNEGTANLVAEFQNASFKNGSNGYFLVEPTTEQIIPPKDSVRLVVGLTLQAGASDPVSDALQIPHNDNYAKQPWEIRYIIDLGDIVFESYKSGFEELGYDLSTALYLDTLCIGESASKNFIVRNEGEVDITIAQPGSMQYFSVNLNGAEDIAVDESSTFTASFDGSGAIPATYSLMFYVKTENCDTPVDSFLVICVVREPQLEITGNGDFGAVNIGTSSVRQFRLTNTGEAPSFIQQVGPLTPPFYIESTTPTIPPGLLMQTGDELLIDVRYSPTDEGPHNLVFKINGAALQNGCPDSVETPLQGTGIQSQVTVYPDSIFYGIFAWCQTAEDSVVVKNGGTADFTITEEPFISGPDAINYSISQRPIESIPITLGPGDSVIYYIRFDASIGPDGDKNALFTIKTDDSERPQVDVKLFAIKEGLDITNDPIEIDFGGVPLGSAGSSEIILTNNGTLYRDIDHIEYSHTDYSGLPPGALLNGGESSTFTLTFKPTRAGSIIDTAFFIINDPCPDTVTVILRGEGLEAKIAFPDTLDFGSVAPCKDTTLQLIFENTGDAPLTIRDMSITGPDQNLFDFDDSPAFPVTLAPAGTLTRTVRFSPIGGDEGIRTATCTAEIDMNGRSFDTTLALIGEKLTGLLAYPEPLDFGSVIKTKTKQMGFTLTNEGILPILIHTIYPFDNPSIFQIDPATINVTLQPTESASFTVTFAPQDEVPYRDSLRFGIDVDGCPDYRAVLVLGEGMPQGIVKLWLPDTLVKPDIDDFRLPVYGINQTPQNTGMNGLTLRAVISFDASLLHTTGISNGQITRDEISGRTRTIEFNAENISIDTVQTVVTEIIGSTLLGEVDSTSLVWEEIEWQPDAAISDSPYEDGFLEIIICREAGDRLITWKNPLEFFIIPNPAGDRINLEVQVLETGRHTIDLMDIQGRTKRLAEWNADDPDKREYEFSFQTGMISAGVYYLKLNSQSRTVVKPLFIIK